MKELRSERSINIIDDYCKGMSISKIITKYKCSFQTCKKILIENNTPIRSQKEASAIEHQMKQIEIERIVCMYLDGLSIRKISKITGHVRESCRKAIVDSGVKIRDWDNRKYTVNDRYFERIDNENKAYWVGFILADGCIASGRNALILGVSIKDRKHLEKLRHDINANNPIYDQTIKSNGFGKNKKCSTIRISSRKIKNDLLCVGIKERKTGHEKPIELDKKYIRHFWRGLVDGDGWVCKYNDRNIIGLCGSYEIVDGFAEFLTKEIGINRLYPKKHKSIYKVVYYGKENPRKIVKLLYEGSAIFLDRKKEIACRIINGDNV